MLFYTHLVVGLFGVLVALPYTSSKVVFVIVGLFASVLPDIDSHSSRLGRKGFFRVLTAFASHRGFFHSLLFMGLIYLVLFNFWSVAALPFLLGYSIHLFLDCFTYRGVRLFFPFKLRVRFIFKSGGFFEIILFVVFLILSCFMFVVRIL